MKSKKKFKEISSVIIPAKLVESARDIMAQKLNINPSSLKIRGVVEQALQYYINREGL